MLNKDNFYEKNIKNAQKAITNFFHFDWDNESLEKQSMNISKCITGSLFWFLIDSSYFRFNEDNIENNMKKIKEYLDSDFIDKTNIEAIDNERYSLFKNNNIINNNKINKNNSENLSNNKIKFLKDKTFFNPINEINNKDKDKEKSFENFFRDISKKEYPKIKNTIADYLTRLHNKNEKNTRNY